MRNMTKRRRYLISSEKKSVLPDEYQEVKWLRGTGTQYCILPYGLGYNDGHFYGIKGDIEALDSTRYSEIWITASDGIPSSSYYHRWGIVLQYGDLQVGVYPDFQHIEYDALSYHFEMNDNSIVKINESEWDSPTYPQSYGSQLYLGAGLDTSSNVAIHNNNVLIKSIELTEDNQTIYTLIPCFRKADNKAGLFYWIDYSQGISGFLTNSAGGSDFLIGPDV